jgi:uncharacterized membrane protein YccC
MNETTLEIAAVHRALEALDAREGPRLTLALGDEAPLPFSLKVWHEAIEASLDRVDALQLHNRELQAQCQRLLDTIAADEAEIRKLQRVRASAEADAAEIRRLRAELAAATEAAAFRKGKPVRTVELERDGSGKVVRGHVFEGL